MVMKRKLKDRGGEEESRLPIGTTEYQGHQLGPSLLASSIFKGANRTRGLQDFVPSLEPILRKWVQEAVDQAIHPFLSSSGNEIESSESRIYKLQFDSNLPHTLFTNSRVVSDGGDPIKIVLYDSCSKSVVKSGPLSAIKLNVVVLDGDFGPDDREDWEKKDFDRKVLQSREGKRPLVTGDLAVALKDGVGYVGEISFTDNSRWIRSGKFRLAATVNASSGEEIMVREGMTNAFKVKDHRGESYQKHYPPSLDDEVWRLEKIAKDGVSHNRLAQFGLLTVQDFLRVFVTDMPSLRAVLSNISNRTWETIIRHATTCRLDNKLYLYRTVCGTGLLFDSIFRVVGVSSDGQPFQSLDYNDARQMGLVEDLKQNAYQNSKDWIQVDDPSVFGYPMQLTSSGAGDINDPSLDFRGRNFLAELEQLAMPINPDHPTESPPFNCEIEQDYSSFENPFVESSRQMQVNPTMSDFIGGFYTMLSEPQLSTDLPIDNNDQVDLSAWHENGLFLDSNNHQIFSSNPRILVARNGKPKTSWCKILTVVKWRILVRRSAAAKKWEQYLYNYCT